MSMKAQMILVAGPYRSGTDGDPEKIAANLHALEMAALAVYQKGHMPMIGEWAALPLAAAAGSEALGDAVSEQFLYPVATRLLASCQAVLRIPGASRGADNDVVLATQRGLTIYRDIGEVPQA